MNSINERIKSPIVVGLIGLVVGTIFGLIVLGWWLWPVKWVNSQPEHMSFDAKVEYLRMAIEAYGQNGDTAKAQARFLALGSDSSEVLTYVTQNLEGTPTELVSNFSNAVATTTPTPEPKTSSLSKILSILLPLLCVLLLVAAAILVYVFIIRGRVRGQGVSPPSPAMQAEEARKAAAYTDYAASGAEQPTAQFMASYKIGDDLFDDSFSIDSASGEFLGECGVGISETIGVGDPKKVTAFEVWLFDKNDIQTVTKVMMSSHSYYDDAIRQRLEAKGEPVLVEPGSEAVLETQTLQLVARVVEMGYGEGAMPSQSFFDNLILELAIWQK
ncbi:MAG: hypothetical protein JXA78_17810 [Anaerolineales bacterium]|nr:hypothetical protein [Anaerolineales bacterium]